MPVNIEYTQDGIGVILNHEGAVTGEELYDSILQVFNDNRYPKLKYWIGDRTNCTKYLLGDVWLRKIADLNKKESSRNPGMLLVLVSPKLLEFGMSRMFQAYSEGSLFQTEVFRGRNQADRWIKQYLDNK